MTLELPFGVADNDFTLRVSLTAMVGLKLPEGMRMLSDTWTITTDEVEYRKPFKVAMNFARTKVDSTKESAGVYWYDDKNRTWVLLDNAVEGSGVVSGNTMKKGLFAVLAGPKPQAVKPAAVPQTPVLPTLTDISGHWAYGNIQKLIALKAVSGNPDGTFQPEKCVTRGEFITMLVKAYGLKGSTEKSFTDLKGHWAEAAVRTAVANGIVTGYADGSVGVLTPSSPGSRWRWMMAKALKLGAGKAGKAFHDAGDISPGPEGRDGRHERRPHRGVCRRHLQAPRAWPPKPRR